MITKLYNRISATEKSRTRFIAGVVVVIGIIILSLAMNKAEAQFWHGDHSHDDNNDTDGCLCVTNGISDSDLAKGMAMAMTAGGHELDYSTTDNQLSFAYARQLDEDEEGAYSVKYGRRWDKLGKALFHVTAVPEQGNDLGNWVMVGTTIRW